MKNTASPEFQMSKPPIRVAVTGAAGQIGYSPLFRIAAGNMLGADQPVILQLLEIPDEKAQKALKGVMMELDDCAFPLLARHGRRLRSDGGVQGRRFRAAGRRAAARARHGEQRPAGGERQDLRAARPGADRVASREVKVLVVGNPANTNCLIAMKNAPTSSRSNSPA